MPTTTKSAELLIAEKWRDEYWAKGRLNLLTAIFSAITEATTSAEERSAAQQAVIEDLETAVKRHVERIKELEGLLGEWLNQITLQTEWDLFKRTSLCLPILPFPPASEVKDGEG